MIQELIRSMVRPLVTAGLTGTVCYLAIIGTVPPEAFLPVVLLVLNWWFEDRREQHRTEAQKEMKK